MTQQPDHPKGEVGVSSSPGRTGGSSHEAPNLKPSAELTRGPRAEGGLLDSGEEGGVHRFPQTPRV